MNPSQKQALFTLRQALVMCEAAGIYIAAEYEPVLLTTEEPYRYGRLQAGDIDGLEKELSRCSN